LLRCWARRSLAKPKKSGVDPDSTFILMQSRIRLSE
jgi:hypothetical protein